ncbi:hypothetical protein O7602_16955 [Micromonospora sp. WMMD1128]|uniref:hypothetical protein n=1 Tax=Micromonospora sp. WMMD1128 TaxID=3015150 RepID=UPI00248AC547|nr:hypothetical protein [Micromonospora sp. WMMD1128]WBB71448.1 hypothetical protein O7602_16955 [Micromonospora sp. WMMD1128]
MTLPERLWGALRLDPSTVAARARFYRAYAELEEPPFDVRDLAELMRDRPPPRGSGPRVINLIGKEAGAVGQSLREIQRPRAGKPWVRLAEAADALRNAAVAELLLDVQTGRGTLLEASRGYSELGLPFGDFLAVAATGDRERSISAAELLGVLLSDSQITDTGRHGSAALATPAQQRYLLLTAAPDATDLWPRLAEAPQAHQTAAVGATSQPFSTWWRLGGLLSRLDADADADGIRRELTRIIAELSEAHGRQLQLAAADDHHWSTGRAQTDLIDLDLAGAVAISARILRQREIRPWRFESDFPKLSPLASISLQIGLQLGDDAPPSDDYLGAHTSAW